MAKNRITARSFRMSHSPEREAEITEEGGHKCSLGGTLIKYWTFK